MKTNISVRVRLTKSTLILFIISTIIQSSPAYACGQPASYEADKIITFEELRTPVIINEAREIKKNGKIILFKNYILINEPDLGVHIYDNSTPENPAPVGFLPIPGNGDIVVKNNVLYADSYVDMVLIDVSDIENAQEIGRLNNAIRPFYSNQSYGLEPEDGVIISIKVKYS